MAISRLFFYLNRVIKKSATNDPDGAMVMAIAMAMAMAIAMAMAMALAMSRS